MTSAKSTERGEQQHVTHVDMLSPSERRKLIKKFIDENIGGDATSFEPIKGEFRKLDEKLHCKRWLEAQFMGKF